MAVIGRPKDFDREDVLRSGMLVFWRKGFAATSMAELIEATGISSSSLYAAFGSKEGFYLEAMDYYARTEGPAVWGKLNDSPTARTGIEELLLAAVDYMHGCESHPAGCMITLGGVSEDCSSPILDASRTYRHLCLDWLQSRLARAVNEGELPAGTDVAGVSRYYLGLLQGIAVQSRDGAAPDELAGIVNAAMDLWPGMRANA